MLLDLGYMPLVTKATRITDHTATLIDHIYTNVPQKITKAGICSADITDHLPVYCTVRNPLPLCQETKYFHDFSHFDKHLLCDSRKYPYPPPRRVFSSLTSHPTGFSVPEGFALLPLPPGISMIFFTWSLVPFGNSESKKKT